MITEKELNDAIAKFEQVEDPNSNTCIALAAFYTVRDHLYPDNGKYSYDYSGPCDNYSSDTEFGQLMSTKSPSSIMPVIDELMTTINVINPQLYIGVLNRLSDIQ